MALSSSLNKDELSKRSPTGRSTSSRSLEGQDLERFAPLVSAIKLDELCRAASRARSRVTVPGVKDPASTFTCTIDPVPLVGAFNLLYMIDFKDGLRWIARFPGSAVCGFEDLDRRQMKSDCRTLQYIRTKTSLPIPNVFAFEIEDNPVGAPYVLTSFIEGTPVSLRWFDRTWITEERRQHILEQLAKLMAQLQGLRFDKIGSPNFNEDGSFSHVGPKCDRVFEQPLDLDNVEVDWGRIVSSGPYEQTRTYLVDDWDDHKDHVEWTHAQLAILRLAVDSIPEVLIDQGYFVLSPPDFNYQNVLIDEEGTVTGIIDWDGVYTHAIIGGYARYPSWITRDWDPHMYAYGKQDSEDGSDSDSCMEEDSPEDLARYRSIYLTAFESLELPSSAWTSKLTSQSHMFEAIEIAIGDCICQDGIVPKLLSFAFHSEVPFTFPEFCDAWLEGNAGSWLEQIQKAFAAMWHY
ncbi:MAG: hypothetical protein M1828_001350 [Chrysothrix sp. TS-e1954]|nr:MAG: hypothetical protein M1828_001350 [Chrysothrix sp. TS-e1954]